VNVSCCEVDGSGVAPVVVFGLHSCPFDVLRVETPLLWWRKEGLLLRQQQQQLNLYCQRMVLVQLLACS
jgi:hypothetical protein